MEQQRWRMQRGAVPVGQRLPHGPAPRRGARAQARPARRGVVRPVSGGLAAASLLLVAVAGWIHV